jgi:hypothetical protein
MSQRPIVVKQSNTALWVLVLLILSPCIIGCIGCAFWGGLFAIDTGFTFQN